MCDTKGMKNRQTVVNVLLLSLAMAAFSTNAMAVTDNLSGGLCALWKVLAGKPLFVVGMLSIFGGGMAIIFGGEMTDMLKKVATTAVVIGIILSAQLLLTAFFPGAIC